MSRKSKVTKNFDAVESALKNPKKEKRDITPSDTMKRIQTHLTDARREVDTLTDSSVKKSLLINLDHLDKKVGFRAVMKARRAMASKILRGEIPLDNVVFLEMKPEEEKKPEEIGE